MKHLLASSTLLVSALAIATGAIVLALNLRIVTPNTLGMGIGLLTCAGLCAMAGTDTRSSRCC